MRGESPTRFADRVFSTLAARQHGVVARWQLLKVGVSARQIDLRLDADRLHQVHRGVYLVGSVARPPHAHEMAALLALRLDATLSHRTATNLWSLLSYPATAQVWLTTSPGRGSRRPGLKVVQAPLAHRDVRRRHGMPLTSPPRTILDMATLLDAEELESLVAEAGYRNLASEAELLDQLDRNPRRRGAGALRAVLGVPGGPGRTRSPAERDLLRLLREDGITGFEVNQRVHGYEVDFFWPRLAFAIELDGYDGHKGRAAFERDRLKWAILRSNGVDVMPLTPRRVRDAPDTSLSLIREALRRAGA